MFFALEVFFRRSGKHYSRADLPDLLDGEFQLNALRGCLRMFNCPVYVSILMFIFN